MIYIHSLLDSRVRSIRTEGERDKGENKQTRCATKETPEKTANGAGKQQKRPIGAARLSAVSEFDESERICVSWEGAFARAPPPLIVEPGARLKRVTLQLGARETSKSPLSTVQL